MANSLSIPQFALKLYSSNEDIKSTKRLTLADTLNMQSNSKDDNMQPPNESKNFIDVEAVALDVSTRISTNLDTKLSNIQHDVLQTIESSMHKMEQKSNNEEQHNAIVQEQSNVITTLILSSLRQERQHQKQLAATKQNCQEQIASTEKFCDILMDISQLKDQLAEGVDRVESERQARNMEGEEIHGTQKPRFWARMKKILAK